MDAAEIARQAAARLHRDAVAAGSDPTQPLAFAVAEASRRGIDVYHVAADHPSLKGGRACYDHQAGHILVADDGTPFQRALLIAHEIGHVELEGPAADDVVTEFVVATAENDTASAAERVVDYSRRERREVRMDLFARELLLPRPILRQQYLEGALTRQDIARRYQAPLDIVTQQLLDALLLPSIPEAAAGPPREALPLDPSQQAAARQRGTAFQLQAGPGTGKTQTLVHHVDGLLADGVPPDSILALTFSNKAAAELIERLRRKHPQAAAGIWAGTFHAFGLDIVRRFHDSLGLPETPRLIDRSEAIELLEDELARLPLRHFRNLWDPTLVLADILSGISRAKDEVADAARYAELADAMIELTFDPSRHLDDVVRQVFVGGRGALGGRRVILEPFLAPDAAVLLLIAERPLLRPLLVLVVVEHAPGLGMHAVEDDVDVGMRGVVMADIESLVLAPSHLH